MKEDFISVKPKNGILSDIIDFYYFQQIQNKGTYAVIYYPNHNTGLNYYYHARVDLRNDGRCLTETKEKGIDCFLTQNTKSARYVTAKGSIRKLGVMFKPLGINHFIQDDLDKLASSSIGTFNYFGDGFLEVCKKVGSYSHFDQKSQILDDFFVSRYFGFEDLEFRNLIKSILVNDEDLFVKNFASSIGVTRKTILRKFRKHLCTTPTDFIAIIKFRRALNQFNLNTKLSQIAYESKYYDQSDFIRQFKKIAGLTPKAIFENIDKKGEFQTLWTAMK
ncbi:MAG: helix-turn-helix domain-containing protein [Bacteroidota bacterium]